MPQRPNIVFILTDQMRGDCLSAAGHPVIRTPTLDMFARQGTLFTRAYASVPSCIAARACMWTGQSASTTGRLGYRDAVPWRYPVTLMSELASGGYQCHCVGKTHFYPQGSLMGFHSMETYEASQNHDGDYVNDHWKWVSELTDGRLHEFDHGLPSNSWAARPSTLPEELHNNTWVGKKSIEFLQRRDPKKPFFLNMSFHRPHAPLDPPQVFFDMYRDRDVPPPPVGDWAHVHDAPVNNLNAWQGRLPAATLARSRRAYYAQVAHIDSQIGRVMRALERMKAGPTAFIFTADHGEMLGDHCLFRKCYAYEGSAGVPLVVALPGERRGAFCDAPIALEDLYPTMLEIAGAPVPERTEGLSLLPLCTRKTAGPWRQFVHGEHSASYSEDEAMQYLTDGKTKYIWFTKSGREQLFDLQTDPQELHDMAADPGAGELLALWRGRLIERLAARPQDRLTDGRKLFPGTLLPAVRPELLEPEH